MDRATESGGAGVLWQLLINAPAGILLRGWVILSYWAWFIIPLGAPAIGFWHALGASALVGYLTMQGMSYESIKLKAAQLEAHGLDSPSGLGDAVVSLLWTTMIALFFMGFGWLYASLM